KPTHGPEKVRAKPSAWCATRRRRPAFINRTSNLHISWLKKKRNLLRKKKPSLKLPISPRGKLLVTRLLKLQRKRQRLWKKVLLLLGLKPKLHPRLPRPAQPLPRRRRPPQNCSPMNWPARKSSRRRARKISASALRISSPHAITRW